MRWKFKERSCHGASQHAVLASLNHPGSPACMSWFPRRLAWQRTVRTATPGDWEHTLQTARWTMRRVSTGTSFWCSGPLWGWQLLSPASRRSRRCPDPKPRKWQVCERRTCMKVCQQYQQKFWSTKFDKDLELYINNLGKHDSPNMKVQPVPV